ncbi:hypothetical protein HYALB_00006912 [Hymenoscyphus albidus]|uniref:Zn(2)-C6 fungal-type domain-containing protein n=1 Tax=Hymenoscyphus albidus TaxID=595503 RepID=A0A9N9LC11_9HELO|nr:hypothetical protein HYALB_00006912 [Hymenoscyphus albidus]
MSNKAQKYKQRILLFEAIQSYGSKIMPCSNCRRYNRKCFVLNNKSQKCGECVRRGVRCDALQSANDDLQSIRLEEERLKFERDMAFEAAMAGLARVRELEQRQQELRERGIDMVRRGLRTLDELDVAEEKERKEKEKDEEKKKMEEEAARLASLPTPSSSDPALDLGLDPAFFEAFPPDSEMWANLGFDGGTPEVPPNTG